MTAGGTAAYGWAIVAAHPGCHDREASQGADSHRELEMTYWNDRSKSAGDEHPRRSLAKANLLLGLAALISILVLILQGNHLAA
jgi:hypothetical protein